MTSITLQSLGLNADEAMALAVAGSKVLKQSSVRFEGYDLEKSDRFQDKLNRLTKNKHMTHVEAHKNGSGLSFF